MGSHSSYIFSFRPSYSHQQPELQKPWSPHYKDKKKMKNSFNTALQVLAVLATLAALGQCVCDCADWGPNGGYKACTETATNAGAGGGYVCYVADGRQCPDALPSQHNTQFWYSQQGCCGYNNPCNSVRSTLYTA